MRSLKYRVMMLAIGTTALALAGCDLSALDPNAQILAAKEAEGKAIGSACRHSGRALEECYANNPKVSKAAIFTGWRDMDGYMRENNIEIIAPATATANAGPEKSKQEEETDKDGKAKKSAGAEPDAKKNAAEAPKDVPIKRAAPGAPGVKQVRLDV